MNYLTKISLNLLIFALIALSGCSSKLKISLTPIQVEHASQTKAWEMQGKLAVKTEQDKFSTNLYWLHTDKQDELLLTTMLGTTVLSLNSDSHGANLSLDGTEYQDKNAEHLLMRLTGWSIPLANLPLWLTGQVPNTDIILSRDNQNRPQMVQAIVGANSWLVNFKSWQQQSGAEIPRLIEISRDGIKLKIQITQWQALSNSHI